jgi:multiple sugar transport system substrate-binding protein
MGVFRKVCDQKNRRVNSRGEGHPFPSTRRKFLKQILALAAGGLSTGSLPRAAMAGNDISTDRKALRSAILKIPGLGKRSPAAADWQKVGELCLGATRANVRKDAFKGVELTFLGLNGQGSHNALLRGFLKPWEDYTGARIDWIDLAQADYYPRLQRAIANGTLGFDLIEMGAPFEGDVCARGLTSPMPDWVKKQIDMEDYAACFQPPVGAWDGRTYRVAIGGDCHLFNYRKDYFSDEALAKAWKAAGHDSAWAVPKTWQEVQSVTRFLAGRQFAGSPAYGYLDICAPWDGFAFYFLASRASAYAKHPADKAWLFDSDTMKPRINNPAFVRAIQDVLDVLLSEPQNQINADPNQAGFAQFLGGTGSMLAWWGDVGQASATDKETAVAGKIGFSMLPGSDDVYNSRTGRWEKLPGGPNHSPNIAYLGWGIYVAARVDGDARKHKAAWSAAAHLGGKDLALWTAVYPTGYHPYRNSQFDASEWTAAGYDEAFAGGYLKAQAASCNHSNAAIEPRIPGLFQYYGLAEDGLANIYAGKISAQDGANAIAANWEALTDQIGRADQIRLYKASLGL